jgi:hypothetical protein
VARISSFSTFTSFNLTSMSMAVKMDPNILHYVMTNDPLPSKLKPIRDACIEDAKTRVVVCDALIGEMEVKILDREAKIKALEKELDDLQVALAQQNDEKGFHDAAIQAPAGSISAFRRIPAEIVASIMIWSVPSAWDLEHLALSRVSSVSRRWRRLTVDLVSISAWRTRQQARKRLAHTLDDWLSRGAEGAGIELTLWAKDIKP